MLCGQMTMHPGMASFWPPSHDWAHLYIHNTGVITHHLLYLCCPTHLTLAILPLPWLPSTKQMPSLLQAPKNPPPTCNKEQENWKEDTFSQENEKKEKNATHTNSPVSMGSLPGWLLCQVSPLKNLPLNPESCQQPLPHHDNHDSQNTVKHQNQDLMIFEKWVNNYLPRFDSGSFCISISTLCICTLSENKGHFKNLRLNKRQSVKELQVG